MKNLIFSLYIILFTGISILFSSCESDSENSSNEDTNKEVIPVPIQEFFFSGMLDNEEYNLRSEIYALSDVHIAPVDEHTIDFGGFGMKRITPNENLPEIEHCLGRYAFGVLPNIYNGKRLNVSGAKMYFTNVELNECSIENERKGLETFFKSENFTFRSSLNDDSYNSISFFFFPPNKEGIPEEDNDFYKSEGENSEGTFTITSVKKEGSNAYILEGTISCKMYSHLNPSEFKLLKDGKFRIKTEILFNK